MGLFQKKVGLADIIRCDEQNYLIWKWHPAGVQLGDHKRENEIRWGSSLRVKDGEVAVFVYKQKDGTMQDFFEGPCDKILETLNFPVLSSVLGAAFNNRSPFQAEIYFINTSNLIQTRFAVPFFDVYDPRLPDHGVPVAVRGTISYKITNYFEFIRLHRLDNFDQDAFSRQIRDMVGRYVKDAVANAPAKNDIPVVQIESKIAQITDIVEYDISQRMLESFGVTVSGVDIGIIEIDKSSQGYKELSAITKEIEVAKAKAIGTASAKDVLDKQRIEAEDYQETLRIKREESQYAKHMETNTVNAGVYQMEKQAEVGIASANAFGQIQANNAGNVNLGNGGSGFNPAALMASMSVGGAIGQNLAGTINNVLAAPAQAGPQTPPPIPTAKYNVVIAGEAAGPFEIDTLRQMAQSNQIDQDTLVWKPGMTNWVLIKDVKELESVVVSIPPAIN